MTCDTISCVALLISALSSLQRTLPKGSLAVQMFHTRSGKAGMQWV